MPRIIHVRGGLLLLGAVLAVALGLVALGPFLTGPKVTFAYEVLVDGRVVTHVDNPDMIREALALVVEEESLRRGHPVQVVSRVEARRIEIDPRASVRTAEGQVLADELALAVRLDARAVAVVVDGEPVVVLSSEAEARMAVERLVADYVRSIEQGQLAAPNGGRIDEAVSVESVEIVEDVRYETVEVSPQEVRSLEQAVAVLARGTDRVVTHTVQHGESLWSIAHANDLTVEDLKKANPQISDPNRIRIGDTLSLVVPEPFVSVRSVETRSYRRRVAFRTVVERDPDLFPWERYVKQPGEYGERAVVERVERVDGQIVDVETVSDELVREPRVQIVVQGSKAVPVMGTGVFRWPLNIAGQVTDTFGYSRWRGRRHNGIDIAAPRGTPVYAADDGYVVTAGWRGGLGRTVIVDHGGGRKTVYAHLSSIAVSVGQQVNQSTMIGRVGNTGYSFGDHLHFEVHVRDHPVDPLQYYQQGQ